MPIEIRPALVSERQAIHDCVNRAYEVYVPQMDREPAPMSDVYATLIAKGRVWDATEVDRLVGLIVMWCLTDHLYIDNIAVQPEAQGTGVGGALLAEAERVAAAASMKEIRLYTNEIMTDNAQYYQRKGYVVTHEAEQNGFRRIFFTKSLAK